jgi:CheY-like chemotaxis protein
MPPPLDQPLANQCILVVEDMPDELRLLAHTLGDAGARVLTAVDGTDALRLARLMRPDAVVMDVRLPPPDGFLVCRALLAQPESVELPVVFISGLRDVPAKLAAFAAGGRDYLTKPFSDAELIARVALHAQLGRRIRAGQPDAGMPRWLSQCVQRLRVALAEPPSLELLAQEVGSTVHGIQEGFRAYLGTTPAAFVREARMSEAVRQLHETATPVAEVGAALGYPNPANFATAFKERFGVSPRQHRQGSKTCQEPAGPIA